MSQPQKSKSFWSKPEGITGGIFLLGFIGLIGFLIFNFFGFLLALSQTPLGMAALLGSLGVLIFMALDNKARSLISYMYKSSMRWITGLFVQMDPIGILKNYVDDLKANLKKMRKQIVQLRGQMHKLKEMMYNNQKEIKSNLDLASQAKNGNENKVVILKTRKAGRLKESNLKYADLYKRMEVLYRVLSKMYDNSEILAEDIEDQVKMKEQERKAIMASHSAMKSAMNIIKGDSDKRMMFDQALEAVADDVSKKVGEMENFMEMSEDFMNSIDLQNGIFEEKGMAMLEKWERESTSLLLGGEKDQILLDSEKTETLDLSSPVKKAVELGRDSNQYDKFFD